MKKFLISALALSATSACVPAIASSSSTDLFGSIAFVGDSITQGAGASNTTNDKSVSYRYSLWKIFVSNGIEWNPVGSMTKFLDTSSANPTQTPNFCGETFDNTNEGHYGWRTYDFINGPDPKRDSRAGSGKLSDWVENTEYYPSGAPDTVTLLLGVNDLSEGKTIEETATNAKNIIAQYQSQNPNVAVHVFSVLPTWQTWNGKKSWDVIADYNAKVQEQIEAGDWNTANSSVQFHDISTGFDPTAHTYTSDNVHPNAAGRLLVAKNIAHALGLNANIDLGITREATSDLTTQTTFANSGTTLNVTATTSGIATTKTFTGSNIAGDQIWQTSDDKHLMIETTEAAESYISLQWIDDNVCHNFTFDISVKITDVTETNNFLGIFLGNGVSVGGLYIGENGIYWNSFDRGNLIYGWYDPVFKTDFTTTEDYLDLRIAYISGDSNVADGYYVWLGDELIGDCLSGVINDFKDDVLIGDVSSSYSAKADIKSISYQLDAAYAPIPEPSAFGLLAGVGALALVASRRRRR